MDNAHNAAAGSGTANSEGVDVDLEALLRECDYAPQDQCQHHGYTMQEIRAKTGLPENKLYRLIRLAIEKNWCRVERRPKINIAGTTSIKPVYIFERGKK